jgi:hypothetical protein
MSDTLLLGLDDNQRIDPATGKAFVAQPEMQRASIERPMLEGPGPSFSAPSMVHPGDRMGMQGTRPAQVRQPTPEDLMEQARRMLDNQSAQTQGNLQRGPAVKDNVPSWLRDEMGD